MSVRGVSNSAVASAVANDPSILEATPQTFTPTTGQTCTLTDSKLNGSAYINPAGALLNLTITLPTNANSRIGQERHVLITQAITNLTINGAASILNTLTSAIANTWVTFRKVASDTWAVRSS